MLAQATAGGDRRKDMKRLFAALTLALLMSLAVGAGVANATHNPNTDGPPMDFATGTGVLLDSFRFQIAARSDASGEDPRGHLALSSQGDEGPAFRSPVTCFIAQGNMAVAGGPSSEQPGTYNYIVVRDNGMLAEGGVPDEATFAHATSFPVANRDGCSFVLAFSFLHPIQGNVTVHDATP
jgi:hypothetical protein